MLPEYRTISHRSSGSGSKVSVLRTPPNINRDPWCKSETSLSEWASVPIRAAKNITEAGQGVGQQ